MRKVIGIDLFAGAGGMSLGARLAGIDVRLAVEIDIHAAQTYCLNMPDVDMKNVDIRRFKGGREICNRSRLVLFGGPPCQGFSTSNQRTRNASNPSNWLFEEFFRLVRQYEPGWVVMENVKGIVETEGGMFLEKILSRFDRLRYRVSSSVLSAKDWGVPQERSRFFIIACRDGRPPELPTNSQKQVVTVWDALADLPLLRNGAAVSNLPYRRNPYSSYARRLRGRRGSCPNHLVTSNAPHVIQRFRQVPAGGNWEDIPARLMSNYQNRSGCHTGIYHRLHPHRTAKIIGNFRKNMLIHPTQDRGLSVREAARLQSFPDSFEFHGSIGFQQQQVGNAVPPLLARAVFRVVAANL